MVRSALVNNKAGMVGRRRNEEGWWGWHFLHKYFYAMVSSLPLFHQHKATIEILSFGLFFKAEQLNSQILNHPKINIQNK